MNSIIVEGHRGWRSDYPENSLVSFEAAMDLGVDAFEFDIRMSKDGVPVLCMIPIHGGYRGNMR